MVAVVTGGASGIGFGLASAFGDRRLVVVLADIEGDALDQAAARLQSRGTVVLPVQVDVADGDQVDSLATQTLEQFGRVDIVCNNAGVVTKTGATWEIPRQDWDWLLPVNLWGVINGITSFVPHLIAQGHGYLVNTASVAGLSNVPFAAHYTATKHAVVAISECLRAELDATAPGVGVSVLCPALVSTRIGEADRNRPPDLARPETRHRRQPERAPGSVILQPDEVARRTIAAIEADRLYVLTHPESRERVTSRIERLIDDLNNEDPAAG